MAKKRLSNLIKEEAEAQKLTPNQADASAIDVEAQTVDNQSAETSTSPDTDSPSSFPTEVQAKTTPTSAPKSPNPKPMTLTKADLETTVIELKQDLEEANKTEAELGEQVSKLRSDLSAQKALTEKLNQELAAHKALTEKLNQELAAQKALSEKLDQELAAQKALTEKLNTELAATKKDALQLAETNTKLTDEIGAMQPANIRQGAIKRVTTKQNSSIIHKSTQYPKRTPRPVVSKNHSQEEGAKNSTQMWLLD
ncbi:MAG: hypothetical protein QNJ36_19505 [Calothrix sp. MO_167.B42]|nr:hypothetical protein [Calothrix sp. MO_167.B42]